MLVFSQFFFFFACSERILLCTNPSPSPLSLLSSGFGSEVSRSLLELKIGDGDLKLSGYIGSPFDSFTIKVIYFLDVIKEGYFCFLIFLQFFIICFYGRLFNMFVSTPLCEFFKSMVCGQDPVFYETVLTSARTDINRRFVCKGQIHKLLNELASRFISLDPQTDHVFHSRKRSRSQANPAYILNLDCPGSFYDVTFESSKTFVQFKVIHYFFSKCQSICLSSVPLFDRE